MQNKDLDDFIAQLPSDEDLDKLDTESRIAQEKLQEEYKERDRIIHRVFEQNENGKKLLNQWVKAKLIDDTSVDVGVVLSERDIGMIIGVQNFIRKIVRTIEKVNKGERG